MRFSKYIMLIFTLCSSPFYINAYKNINNSNVTINVIEKKEVSSTNKDIIINDTTFKEEENKSENRQPEIKENITKTETTSGKKNTQENKVIQQPNESTPVLTPIEKISSSNDKLGTMGRLYVPDSNFNVAVYYAEARDGKDYNAQEIVDRKDSAAYFHFGPHEMIADHNYQGFKKIISMKIGTKAYIKMNDGTILTYELKNKINGNNLGTDIITDTGISITDLPSSLVMYTCTDSSNGIMITFWNLV